LVDGENIGVIQRGHRACFLFEALQAQPITCKELGQDLDRDVALEPRIASTINLAHSANA